MSFDDGRSVMHGRDFPGDRLKDFRGHLATRGTPRYEFVDRIVSGDYNEGAPARCSQREHGVGNGFKCWDQDSRLAAGS